MRTKSNRVCSVEGCTRKHYSRGYCNAHWQRDRNGLPLDTPIAYRSPAKQNAGKRCSVKGCWKWAYHQGQCAMHYGALYKLRKETQDDETIVAGV